MTWKLVYTTAAKKDAKRLANPVPVPLCYDVTT